METIISITFFVAVMMLTSAWIYGIHCILSAGYLLETVGDILDAIFHPKIRKVIFTCPPCMSSLHGTIAYWIFLHQYGFWLWPVFVIALCGVNSIINEIKNAIDR